MKLDNPKYLGPIITRDGELPEDSSNKIRMRKTAIASLDRVIWNKNLKSTIRQIS